MERQHGHSPRFKSIAGSALVGAGFLALLGNLGWSALLRNCFCTTAGDALGVFPCLILAACQAIQAYVLGHHWLLEWVLRMLVSLWPLLPVVGGTI